MYKHKERVYLLMLLPALLGFSILFILPSFMSLFYSFTNWSVYKQAYNFVFLDNYIKLLGDKSTMTAISNSLKYAFSITIIQNGLSLLFAYILTKKVATLNLVKSVLFLPSVISILVVGYLWSFMMSSSDAGLFNYILSLFNIKAIYWLSNPRIALFSVVAAQVWQWTGYSLVIYMANMKSIDTSYYEASKIDGASRFKTFKYITLPLLYPAISFNVLMSLIGGFKVFDIIMAMTEGGPGNATETIMTTLIRIGFTQGRNAYASAFAMVFFVLVFIITKVLNYLFAKWEATV